MGSPTDADAAPREAAPREAAPREAAPREAAPREVVVRRLGSGKYSDVFLARCGQRRVAFKISYYRDSTLQAVRRRALRGDTHGALAAKKADAVAVSWEFSKFTQRLLDAVSPHFVVVFSSEDVDGLARRLRGLLRARLAALTAAQSLHTNVCFMEKFDSSLTAYLRAGTTDAVACGVVFQVVYTLAALQRLLPGFRHNDLSTNNVLVRAVPPWTGAYAINRRTYFVTVPVFVALADYDFLHVPGHATLSNERILGGRYPDMSAAPNPSYDVHLFLASVERCLRGQHVPRTHEFLRSLGLHASDRIHTVVPKLFPGVLVMHPYFDSLLKPRRATAAFAA